MRRHLGYTPAEVRAMDPFELTMWIEKLHEEFPSDPDNSPTQPRQVTDDAAAFGLNVQELQ